MSDEEVVKKLELAEKELENLRKLSLKAVEDYDELKVKYDENIIAYYELQKSCQDQEKQLNNIPEVLESVAAEYDEINTRYQLESGLRSEAETYASKITKENKKLKRQSQALLSKFNLVSVDIDIDDIGGAISEEEEGDSASQKEVDRLNEALKGLQDQISELHHEVQKAVSDKHLAEMVATEAKKKYEDERKANEKNKYSLEYYQKSLKQLERASVLLVQDYDTLYTQMEQQKLLQSKAEEYASKMVQDREAMKRQSSALIASAATSDRLMKAMLEIEDLTKELEGLKHNHLTQIEELKAELDNTFEIEKICTLEEQLKLSTTEVSILERRITDAEAKIQTLEKENSDLEEKLKNPPPPPPPPPPPVKSLLPTLSAALKRKERKKVKDRVLQKAAGSQNEGMTDAINEMMERIKKGTALKKRVSTGNKPLEIAKTEGKAIGEMHGILSSLKTKRSLTYSGRLPGGSNEPKVDNQLLKMLQAKRDKIDAHLEKESPKLTIQTPASQPHRDSKPLPSPRKSVRKLSNIAENKEKVIEEEAMYEEVRM